MKVLLNNVLIIQRQSNNVLLWTPGGAISNLYAMLIARFKMFPEVKEKGMAAIPRLVAFTSEQVGLYFILCIIISYLYSVFLVFMLCQFLNVLSFEMLPGSECVTDLALLGLQYFTMCPLNNLPCIDVKV